MNLTRPLLLIGLWLSGALYAADPDASGFRKPANEYRPMPFWHLNGPLNKDTIIRQMYRAKHEAELVIFEAAKSTLLAMQGDQKLPSLKSLQAEQQRLLEDQKRLYDERAKLKKEARVIDTMKANVDDFLSPTAAQDRDIKKSSELE